MMSRFAPLFGVVLLGSVVLFINLLKVDAPTERASEEAERLAKIYAALHPDGSSSARLGVAHRQRIVSMHPFVRERLGVPHLLAHVAESGEAHSLRLQPLDGGEPAWHYPLTTRADRPVRVFEDDEGGLALVAQGTGVVALGLEDGEPRWSIILSNAVESIGRRDGRLIILTEDRRVRSLDPTDGSASPTAAVPVGDELLRGDHQGGAAPRDFFATISLDGLDGETILCGPRRPCARLSGAPRPELGLAFATAPGLIPVVAAYNPKTDDELWREPQGGAEARVGWATESPFAVLVGDDAIVTFLGEDHATHFVRLGVADGAVRWRKIFPPRSSGMNWNNITASDGRLLYHDGRSLRTMDPETGDVEHCLGPCDDR